MEYITAQEAARKWGISVRLVQKYCAGGRIRGVVKFGQSWGIPENAVKPSDPRRKKEKNQGTAAGGEEKTLAFTPLRLLLHSSHLFCCTFLCRTVYRRQKHFYRICRRV